MARPLKDISGPLIIRDLSGGVNSGVSDYFMPANAMRYAINMYSDPDNTKYGSMTSRLGFQLMGAINANTTNINTDIAGVDPADFIIGMHYRGHKKTLIAVQDASADATYIYLYDGTNFLDIGGTPYDWSSNGTIRMETFVGYTFACDGNSLKSWDGVTANNWGTTQLTSAPTGVDLIKNYNDRLLLAAFGGTRIYYCDVDTSGNLTWDTSTKFIDVSPDDPYGLTGYEVYGDTLIIFKMSFMYSWDGSSSPPNPLYKMGACNPEVIQKVGGKLIFTGYNELRRLSVYEYEGSEPKDISLPIRGWLDAIEAQNTSAAPTNIAAFVHNNNYCLSVHDVTRDGITWPNVILIYNTTTGIWEEMSISKEDDGADDVNNYLRHFAYYRESNTTPEFTRLTADMHDVQVLVGGGPISSATAANAACAPVLWNSRKANATFPLAKTDNGRPINIFIETPNIDHGTRSNYKNINKFTILSDGNYGAVTNVSLIIEDDEEVSLGGLTGKATTFAPAEKARWYAIRLTGANIGEQYVFEGIEFTDVQVEDFEI